MNRDIEIMRGSIVKITQMLAGKGLKVTQQGSQAYVKSDSNGNIKQVNIPYLADNASEDLIIAIQGFIDHEVGHVLFTDWKAGLTISKSGVESKEAGLASLHNIFEDPFVEREMGKKFPGSVLNLEKTGEFFLAKISEPALKAVKGNAGQEFSIILVPAVRALSGQAVFAKWMKDNKYWDHPLIAAMMAKIPADLIKSLPTLKNSAETYQAALVLNAIIYPPKPPASEKKPEKGEDDDSGSSDSKSKGEKKSKDAKKSEPKKSPEKEKDDKPEHEESEDDKSEAEAEPVDKSDSDAEEPTSEDSDLDDRGDGKSGESTDADEPEDDRGSSEGEGSDDDEDYSGDEDYSDKGESDESDDDSGEDDEVGSAGGKSDSESGTGKGSSVGEEDKSSESDESGMGSSDPFKNSEIDLRKASFEDAICDLIAGEAARHLKGLPYTVFSNDFDKVEKYKVCGGFRDEFVTKMDDRVRSIVGAMQKSLERLMAARSNILKVPGFRSGRLHAGNLYRLQTNDDRIFRRTHETSSKDTAVSLLIDNSGSMRGSKVETAMVAAYALSLTLDRIGITHEALGFTTVHTDRDIETLVEAEYNKTGLMYSRYEPLFMPIYKGFEERMNPTVRGRFADMIYNREATRILCQNIDGECLRIAGKRLLGRKEKRKVMIVLSDGSPACSCGNFGALNSDLHAAIAEAEKAGVEIIGIGVQTDVVKAFYKKHIVLDDVALLPATIMGQLKGILLR